jgi:hypothetical protein
LQAVQKFYTVSTLLIKALTASRWASRIAGSDEAQAELSDVRRSGRPTTVGTQESLNVLMPRPQTINSDLYGQTFKNMQKRFRKVLPHADVTEILLQHEHTHT